MLRRSFSSSKVIVFHSQANNYSSIAITSFLFCGFLTKLIFNEMNAPLYFGFILSYVVSYAFDQEKVLRLKDGRLEYGVKKGLRTQLADRQEMKASDFEKIEVRQRKDLFFELHLVGRDNQEISFIAMPNKNPALEKASAIEQEIRAGILTQRNYSAPFLQS